MANGWLSTNGWGVADSIAATAIWAFGAVLLHKADRFVSMRFKIPAVLKALIAIVAVFAGMCFFPGQGDWRVRLTIYLVGGILLAFFMRAILKGYDHLGIASAFNSTHQGVNFEQSLALANTSLDFLGIGANKLTEKTEAFEGAMRRCATGGKTVRLLLSHPDDPLLKTLARRNDKDPDRYSRNVHDSLKRIARLATDKEFDIQVRFYPNQNNRDFQIFRLMFINDALCLWSWTVWDTEIGRNNPQVILLNKSKDGPNRSAYHAFHDYFNRLWQDQSVVEADLSAYRDEK